MDRKKFLITTSLAVFSLTTFGSIVRLPNGNFNGDCKTTNDILGPFYRADAPLRSDLTSRNLKGKRITLNGVVYKSDCTTPLENVMVEIWHCDSEGVYDNDSPAFNQRARLYTDVFGKYSFSTILPGKYMNGKLYRPAHIHYRVTEKYSQELISQIYFKGDPDITKDPWASQDRARFRILELQPAVIDGSLSLNFDIFMKDK